MTINVVARGTRASPDKAGDSVPALGDRDVRARDAFPRAVFSVTEQTENLVTRAHFLPPILAGLNVGGG